MTNKTARENFRATMEQHKGAMLLKLGYMILDKENANMHFEAMANHFENLCTTIEEFKEIPDDNTQFKGI
jgi:hypothetical protein